MAELARRNYAAGDWFAVPLREGGFAVGVVALAQADGVLRGYLFGLKREDMPQLIDVEHLMASDTPCLSASSATSGW